MSNTTENVLTKTYHGKFGDQVVFRNRDNKSIMAKPPKKSLKPPTELQIAIRRKFKMASRWAQLVLRDPAILEEYKALSKGMKTPYVMAVTNYLSPPSIQEIITTGYTGATGNKINVVAFDDFKVTGVSLLITDNTGAMIEQGECEEDLTADCWVYTATKDVTNISGTKIIAEAKDVPCHSGLLEITL